MGLIDRESLVTGLHELGAVQFGDFTLKSGEQSPIYVDLRLLITRPAILRRVANVLQSMATRLTFDRLAAIPMAGLPIGVALSLMMDRPLIYPRLQTKMHGTGREIEGEWRTGESVLLIDDVISGGQSKIESITVLEAAGLKIVDMLVVIDRQMGGAEEMAARGYRLHSTLTLTDILDILLRLKRITKRQHQQVNDWLQARKGSEHAA